MFDQLEANRKNGDQDDRDHHQPEVIANDGDIAEEVAGEDEDRRPDQGSDDVVDDELAVTHRPDAGDERRERAYDRDEAGEEDRLGAVLLVEPLRPHEIGPLEEANVILEHPWSETLSDPIVDRVPYDGRRGQQDEKDPHVQRTGRSEG